MSIKFNHNLVKELWLTEAVKVTTTTKYIEYQNKTGRT